jgi:hypothetical protein
MRIHRKAWSGVALMLGGLGFLLTKARHWIDPADRFLAPYMALSLFLLLWGSVAFYRRYAVQAGRVGQVGLGAAVGGLALLSVTHAVFLPRHALGSAAWVERLAAHEAAVFLGIVLGGLTLVFGLIVFGIGALRCRALPRWRATPLLCGVLGLLFFVSAASKESYPGTFLTLRSLFALSWVALGYVLWRDPGGKNARRYDTAADPEAERTPMISVGNSMALALVIALAACGGDSDTRNELAADPATDAAPAPGAADAGSVRDGALTVNDLDAYERGVEAEIAAVGEAERRRAAATSPSDTLEALADATELRTIEVGARAAGMPVDRYREVRQRVEGVLRANATPAASQMMGDVDTTNAPPEVRARVRENIREQEAATARARETAFAGLDPQVAAALRSRVDRLDSLRMRLVAERIRVAERR